MMFQDIAPVYDLMKAHRNYVGEASVIRQLIQERAPHARRLLEVACGTGTLLNLLDEFDRRGLDISPHMLALARKKLGDAATLYQGKMEDFQLPPPGADVLLCLDGAVGYLAPAALEPTLSKFAHNMMDGGLIILEPWYSPEDWRPGRVHLVHHQTEEVTVVRVGFGYPDGAVEFHNVVGTADGIHAFDERYDFTLHTPEELASALEKAGFIEVRKEAAPCFRRGLLTARLPRRLSAC